ncbi:30S ribosomal protein S24e [uncultured archaeon]|nr:30S ribosomal protein S24e [uncultured archaeon]
MNITITQEKNNKSMKRLEISAELNNDGSTISRQKIREKISEHYKKPVEQVQIVKVEQKYGSKKALTYANIYEEASLVPDNYLNKRGTKKEKKA